MSRGIQPMIYGLHDLSERGGDLMGGGWLVDAVAVWHDPTDTGGADYRHWTDKGCTVICRLNNGWNPKGTIPLPEYYDQFAQRCANFVQASQGCHIWVIGNEWNLEIERPWGRLITVEQYIECYQGVRKAIKAVAPDDWVVPAAIGPWNTESGDWLALYKAVLQAVEADAICWHVYSHGYDPALVTDDTKMATHPDRFYNFRCYRDFELWTPADKRDLPVIVTEANGNGPWQATGWIQAAYQEILQSAMDVRCMCLFRAARTGDGYGLTEASWAEFERAIAGGNGEPPQEGGMQNPSFELPYITHQGTVKVAEGWTPFYSLGLPPQEHSQGPCAMPEYKPLPRSLDARRVVDGDTAQCWFLTDKVFDAGVWQQVIAIKGAAYQFDVSAQAYCSKYDDPTKSEREMYISLGIDPTGGTNAFELGVQWTGWQPVDNQHRRFESLIIQAQGDAITLFIRCWPKWKSKHNDIYVDDAHLHVSGGPEPPTPPEGGVTEERVIELINEYGTKLISGMVPGMIKMHAPNVIADKLKET